MSDDSTASQPAADHGQAIVHTPGPWKIRHRVNVYAVRTDVGHEGSICSTGTHGSNQVDCDPENAANAKLIAAAPDLLAAAKLFLEMWRRSGPLGSHQFEKFDSVVRACRIAVEKARGE